VADADRGWPKTLVMDNGPEFTGQMFIVWARRSGMTLHFTDPGKPVQNAYIESFHGKLQDGYLNEHWFLSLADARRRLQHGGKTIIPVPCTAGWDIGSRRNIETDWLMKQRREAFSALISHLRPRSDSHNQWTKGWGQIS